MLCQIVVSENNVLVPALRPDWTEGGKKILVVIIIIDTWTVLTTHKDATCDLITATHLQFDVLSVEQCRV